MSPVTNSRKSVNIDIESILNAPNPTHLVQLIRKNRGRPGNPIVFNDSESENPRKSFPLKFLDVPAAVQNTQKSLEGNGSVSNIKNQSEKSLAEINKWPTRPSGPRVKLKRLRESLARRTLVRDMEKTLITSIFHPDAASTPIQQLTFPIVLCSDSDEVEHNANKNTPPNASSNSAVSGKNTIKQSVSINLDATKHHTERSIGHKPTGCSGTQYYHESIEISGEIDRIIVNEIPDENEFHLAQVSQQNPANNLGANNTHNSILESVQSNSTRNLTRSRTTGQSSQIERTSVQEVPPVTPLKIGQIPDSSAIILTLTNRRPKEHIKRTISASKIPRRIIINNGEPNRPAPVQAECALLTPGRSSVVVMPIYSSTCRCDSNTNDEQSVEPQQQSVVNATRKSSTKKVVDQSLMPSDQHAAGCSLTSRPPLQFQITSDEDSSNTDQEIPSNQCSSLRQTQSNRVEDGNRSAENLPEKRHFNVAIVDTWNQHQTESHHMGHSSSQAIDLRLSCRRNSQLPASHEESGHRMNPIPSTANESSSDSIDSESSGENIAKINDKLNNDHDSLQRHNSSGIRAEQHQLPQVVEKFTNRENTESPSCDFNESVFEGITGREGRPNDIVFDLSQHRGQFWIDMMLRKETTGASRKETTGASRTFFNRRRGKRVISEIVPKQSQTLFEERKSSLPKSNRKNSNRNSKRKLYSHVEADIENETAENRSESHSENQSLVSKQHQTNSPICKLFGFFLPIVLDAANSKPKTRNLKHAKTIRIETTQKLLDSWRPISEKRQHVGQPKESLGNEDEEPIFKVPEPPTRRKPIRAKLAAKNPGESCSLTNGTVSQTSASEKSSKSMNRSNKVFESKVNRQSNDRFINFRSDDDSFTTETPIQNGYRKCSRSTDRITTNTESESKSTKRVSLANFSDDDQIHSVLPGTANKSKQSSSTTPRQQQQNSTVNGELQSTTTNSPKSNGLRHSARRHHAPRPYWTSKRDCYPIVEVNYKEPNIKESRKRKTVGQQNKTKKKLEMVSEAVAIAGAADLCTSKKIVDDLFDTLKELSQTNDPSTNTIRSESVAAASVSREDSLKSKKSKRQRKNTKKKTAVVAKSATVLDSNMQGNTTAANNYLLSWLKNLVGMQTISSHPDLYRVFKLSGGMTIVPSQHLILNSIGGVDYAYYDENFVDSEHYGYMRFNPNSTKPTARTKKFKLMFLSIVGELNLTIDKKSMQLKGGVFITIPKEVKYSLANRSDETALIFFIKS